ncbi:MAG: PilZ domain-containing protein [Nitrospirota bacterium]|nr:PilZ domain-containing protein [Nitrospirota bacterium]
MTMQARCRLRVPVGYPASIQSDTDAGDAVLLDLSPTGCRMRSDIALNAGAYLTLRIAVAQEPTPLAVEVSVVRWCKDGHFGVEFLRYSQGDRERVTHLVATLPPHEIPVQPAHATSTLSPVGS